MTVEFDLTFLKGVEDYYRHTQSAVDAAFPIALNETARKVLDIGGAAMNKQVKFPPGYLKEPERFFIDEFATASSQKAVVSARSRGTSLYRFAVGNPTPESTRGWEDEGAAIKLGGSAARRDVRGERAAAGKSIRLKVGVQVEVKPGHLIDMPTAFVVNFNGNLQVAIKLKNGRFPAGFNKKLMTAEPAGERSDLYILYGPSVDQVFNEVREQIAPDVMQFASDEFRRQFFVRLEK